MQNERSERKICLEIKNADFSLSAFSTLRRMEKEHVLMQSLLINLLKLIKFLNGRRSYRTLMKYSNVTVYWHKKYKYLLQSSFALIKSITIEVCSCCIFRDSATEVLLYACS